MTNVFGDVLITRNLSIKQCPAHLPVRFSAHRRVYLKSILYLSSFHALPITYHLLLFLSVSSLFPQLFIDLTLQVFLFSFLVMPALRSRKLLLLLSFCLLLSASLQTSIFQLPSNFFQTNM